MPSLNMKGPYSLDAKTVDANIFKESIGNYALGTIDQEGQFVVKYVGRSDADLRERIKDHLDDYPCFKFSYADDAVQAYQKECINYHDFSGDHNRLDNVIHPDKPEGRSDLKCPRCRT